VGLGWWNGLRRMKEDVDIQDDDTQYEIRSIMKRMDFRRMKHKIGLHEYDTQDGLTSE
jgi:hypothetical protein